MPLVAELDRRRAAELGLKSLRPWDTDVDPKGRPALAPFAAGRSDVLVEKTGPIFGRMSAALGGDFESLRRRNNLDLDSRKGKQPGGYQSTLNEVARAVHLHERGGLAAGRRDAAARGRARVPLRWRRGTRTLVFLRHAPIEFCEVASMSMELLGADHYDLYYDDAADAARARRMQLEGVLRILPWIATDRLVPALDLHAPRAHAASSEPSSGCRCTGGSAGRLDWSGYEHVQADGLAAAAAPVPRAVLLRRVRHRAARRTAALGEEP